MALRLRRAQKTVPVAGTAGLRRAEIADASACGDILNHWIDTTGWVPRIHQPADVSKYLRDIVFRRHTCWVAENAAGVCGFLALDEDDTGASNADATGGEPIFKGETGIGRVTSGAYGYSVGMSLALGYVKGAEPGDEVHVMVLGRPHRARILEYPPFDPDGARLRA